MQSASQNKDKYKALSGSLKSYVHCHPQNLKSSGVRIAFITMEDLVEMLTIITQKMIIVVEQNGERDKQE